MVVKLESNHGQVQVQCKAVRKEDANVIKPFTVTTNWKMLPTVGFSQLCLAIATHLGRLVSKPNNLQTPRLWIKERGYCQFISVLVVTANSTAGTGRAWTATCLTSYTSTKGRNVQTIIPCRHSGPLGFNSTSRRATEATSAWSPTAFPLVSTRSLPFF